MTPNRRLFILVFTIPCLAPLWSCFSAEQPKDLIINRNTFLLGSGRAVVKNLQAVPPVDSEYSKCFRFDTFENPKLKELRERYKLQELVAPGKDEFDKQVILLDWVHHQFKKFGRPTLQAKGALEILRGIQDGHSFFCSQYAQLFVSASASLGWVDRELALRRHQGNAKGGSSEHSTTEIWSNQRRKWVMMDPTANMHIERDGVPLNAYEIRQEWFYKNGTNLTFVIGKERKKYRKADLPIFLARFAGFGDLTVPEDEPDKYGFIGYIPNTNLMDEREDYAKMFISKDQLCDGTRWHTRKNPANPAVDPYFPLGQVGVNLGTMGGFMKVGLKTMTPNLRNFQFQIDGAEWKDCSAVGTFDAAGGILWNLNPGLNRLNLRTVNKFGVKGPVSTVEIALSQ